MVRDEQLVHSALSGDPIAMEQILKRYEHRIYRVVLRILRHHHDAEDVTQQTMAAIAKCLKQYRSEAQFSTWVLGIARNQTLKVLRQRQQQPSPLFGDKASDRRLTSLQRAGEWRFSPEVIACQAEDQRLLEEALGKCGMKYRLVFHLRHREGWSTRQVAEALQVTEATVKVRLHRVHACLRGYLHRKHGSLISD